MSFTTIFLCYIGGGLAQETKHQVNINLKDQLPAQKRWGLILLVPRDDPVHLSSWYLRESCEWERSFLVRVALDKGTPLPVTHCIDREEPPRSGQPLSENLGKKIDSWLSLSKRQQGFWTFSTCPVAGEISKDTVNTIGQYLEDAVNTGGMMQKDIEQTMRLCKFTSVSLSDKRIAWRKEYENGSRVEYLLTFDEQKILREWQGNKTLPSTWTKIQ